MPSASEVFGASAASAEPGSSGGLSQATRLVDLALAHGVEVWHSPAGDPHATIRIDAHREHHRLAARHLRDYLARLYHVETGRAPGSQALTDALTVLAGMARYDGPEHETHVRVTGTPGRVYLDLGDPSWRAVEITAAGWRIEPHPPVRLVRSRGMLALPTPTPGGTLDTLRELLHVVSDEDWRLLAGWEIGAVRPTGPYPPLAWIGEQGSGKSTRARMLRRLIDPHVAELRAEPRDVTDIMIAAARSRIVALDNLSHLAPWLSDALCRLSTGGALSRRELYTDSDEVILEAMRPVILTSITDIVSRGDLLDRAIIVTLPALPDADRRDEADLWRRYDQAAPGILGALLDAVAGALAHVEAVHLSSLPRMADWAVWVTAAERGLGWPAESVVDAYHAMRGTAVETLLDGDPLAVAIRALALPWEGTAAELLARLAPAGRTPRGWPESPRALAAALRRLAPGLRRAGLEIHTRREAHTGRRLLTLISRDGETPDRPSPSSPSSPRADSLRLSGDDAGDGCVTPDFASPGCITRDRADCGLFAGNGDGGDDGDGCAPTSPHAPESGDDADVY